jgi:hypothetical protein
MFLRRILAACKSPFLKRPPEQDLNADARVILRRVRELMELTPALPLTSCGTEPTVSFEAATSLGGTDAYGERTYAEDTH